MRLTTKWAFLFPHHLRTQLEGFYIDHISTIIMWMAYEKYNYLLWIYNVCSSWLECIFKRGLISTCILVWLRSSRIRIHILNGNCFINLFKDPCTPYIYVWYGYMIWILFWYSIFIILNLWFGMLKQSFKVRAFTSLL